MNNTKIKSPTPVSPTAEAGPVGDEWEKDREVIREMQKAHPWALAMQEYHIRSYTRWPAALDALAAANERILETEEKIKSLQRDRQSVARAAVEILDEKEELSSQLATAQEENRRLRAEIEAAKGTAARGLDLYQHWHDVTNGRLVETLRGLSKWDLPAIANAALSASAATTGDGEI